MPVLAAFVGLVVGWFGRQATIGSAKIAAGADEKRLEHEKAKHADERRDRADGDFRAVQEAIGKLRLQSPIDLRQRQAAEAEAAVLRLGWSLGGELVVDRATFDELVTYLRDAKTEAELDRAAKLGEAFLSELVLGLTR